MNVVGERLKVLDSSDPTVRGLKGVVLLETANTLVINSGSRNFRVAKAGSAFKISGSKEIVLGQDIAGRLEDRLVGRKR